MFLTVPFLINGIIEAHNADIVKIIEDTTGFKANLKGIKIHPDFQKFQADCPEMDDIYEKIASLGMPVLFHAGDCRYDFYSTWS